MEAHGIAPGRLNDKERDAVPEARQQTGLHDRHLRSRHDEFKMKRAALRHLALVVGLTGKAEIARRLGLWQARSSAGSL